MVYYEQAGIFVIEVKAVPLNMVEEFGYNRCIIQGHEPDRGPHNQVYKAQQRLRDYLTPQIESLPWISSTACWPKISLSAWNRRWDDQRVCGKFAESMIFEEDLYATPAVFVDRLRYIRYNPPVREGMQRKFVHSHKILANLKRALDVTTRPKQAPSDLERLRVIESDVSRETLKEVPPIDGIFALYYGHPGTGKTFRLLQIGVSHATAGRRVLFTCFNKVLGADIRRLLSYSRLLKTVNTTFEVTDVFEMLSLYAGEQKLMTDEADPDQWGASVTRDMKENRSALQKFDTILVDEAQDMRDWALEMIELHAAPNATLCVAAGSGQELYGKSGQWLEIFEEASTIKKRLNRNFRNTRPVFQVAQACYETKLDRKKIDAFMEQIRNRTRKENDQAILFDEMCEGQAPLITPIYETELEEKYGTSLYADVQHDEMVKEYVRIIQNQIERLTEEERPIDLLILVPSVEGLQRRWDLEALKRLGIGFIYYTDDQNRRQIAQPNMVRLCTFHSSRGIEAMRLVVFGFEWVDRLAERLHIECHKLAYIVLSRTRFECVLATRQVTNSDVMQFVSEAIGVVNKSSKI